MSKAKFINTNDAFHDAVKNARKKYADVEVKTKEDVYALMEKICGIYPNSVLHCSDIQSKVKTADPAITIISLRPGLEDVARLGDDAMTIMLAVSCASIIKDYSIGTNTPPKTVFRAIKQLVPEIERRVKELSKIESRIEEELNGSEQIN